MTNPSVLILRITAAILIILVIAVTALAIRRNRRRERDRHDGHPRYRSSSLDSGMVCRMTALPTLKRAASKCTKPAV